MTAAWWVLGGAADMTARSSSLSLRALGVAVALGNVVAPICPHEQEWADQIREEYKRLSDEVYVGQDSPD